MNEHTMVTSIASPEEGEIMLVDAYELNARTASGGWTLAAIYQEVVWSTFQESVPVALTVSGASVQFHTASAYITNYKPSTVTKFVLRRTPASMFDKFVIEAHSAFEAAKAATARADAAEKKLADETKFIEHAVNTLAKKDAI